MKRNWVVLSVFAVLCRGVLGDVASSSVVVSSDFRDYNLVVKSDYGRPTPSVGAHSSYCWRSTVTCSVDLAVNAGGTNYASSGWWGDGLSPASGGGSDSVELVLTSVNSSVAWGWRFRFVDMDVDDLPDWWEVAHYGSYTNANPSGICSNGVNTIMQAYIAGLNPLVSDSFFEVVGEGNALSWPAVSGRVYSVYWSSNLLSHFEIIESNITSTAAGFVDVEHKTGRAGYYKVAVQVE